MKFLEWFIREDVQKKWAELGGYTAHAAIARVRGVPQRHALQRGLLPVDVHGEGLLGGAGVRRAADRRSTTGSIRYVVGGEGTAKEALDGARRRTGQATFKKYGRS